MKGLSGPELTGFGHLLRAGFFMKGIWQKAVGRHKNLVYSMFSEREDENKISRNRQQRDGKCHFSAKSCFFWYSLGVLPRTSRNTRLKYPGEEKPQFSLISVMVWAFSFSARAAMRTL